MFLRDCLFALDVAVWSQSGVLAFLTDHDRFIELVQIPAQPCGLLS